MIQPVIYTQETIRSGQAGLLSEQTNPDPTHQPPCLFARAARRPRGPRSTERCRPRASGLWRHSGPSLMFSESPVGFFPHSPTFYISPFSFLPSGLCLPFCQSLNHGTVAPPFRPSVYRGCFMPSLVTMPFPAVKSNG